MILPFITLLKLIALGSIKLIFLLFGIAFFPVFALKFILGGAASMLLPTLNWLEQNERLDDARHKAIVEDLNELSTLSFTNKEAREILWKLINKMATNFTGSVRRSITWVRVTAGKLFG